MKHISLVCFILSCLYIPSSMAGMYDGYGNAENPEFVEKAYNLKGKNHFVDNFLHLREEIRMMNKNDIDFLLKKVAKTSVDIHKVTARIEQEQELMKKYNNTLKEQKKNLTDDRLVLSTIVSKSCDNTQMALPKAANLMLHLHSYTMQHGELPFTPVDNQVTVTKYALLATYIVGNGYKNIGEAIKKHPDLLDHISLVFPATIPEIVHTDDVKNSVFYDANNGEPRLWMPNAGYIFRGNPVVKNTPISIESNLFSGISGKDYQIRGLDCISSLSTIFRTNARLSTKGIYLSYQNWLGKLTEAEKVKFEKWSASRQSSSLNGFEFIKWKDLQAGDLVNWRSIDEDAVGHILMFVSWIDKSEKNPIFIGIDFNTFDAYLDGPSVRSFPVNINRPNIASSFLRKL